MDALRPFSKCLRYSAYDRRSEAIEPIFILFLTESNTSNVTREVSKHMKVPISILYSWCEKVRADPNWRPSPEHFSSNANAFPLEVEAPLSYSICLHFVSQNGP
jgi:hypothetical protein